MIRKYFRRHFLRTRNWLNFARRIRPQGQFSADRLPIAIDYSSLSGWAAHPDKEDKSCFLPDVAGLSTAGEAAADAFYLHPTSYFGNQWNASPADGKAKELVDELMVPAQASAFNGCCRIFAPYYRQATFYSFLRESKDGRRALELAYSDVKRAFEYYLEHLNQGRPFFLVSHSQGTLHATRLLEEVIDPGPNAGQLVAAYVPGFRFPLEKARRFRQIKICADPLDVNCLIAWDCYLEGQNPHSVVNRTEHYYQGRWKRVSGKPVVGVNPLRWSGDLSPTPAELNLGAVSLTFRNRPLSMAEFSSKEVLGIKSTGLSVPFPNEVGARLRKDGILYITRPEHGIFRRMVLPGNNYHNYDFALFYMNIRQNAIDRLSAYFNLYQ